MTMMQELHNWVRYLSMVTSIVLRWAQKESFV